MEDAWIVPPGEGGGKRGNKLDGLDVNGIFTAMLLLLRKRYSSNRKNVCSSVFLPVSFSRGRFVVCSKVKFQVEGNIA